MITYCLYT